MERHYSDDLAVVVLKLDAELKQAERFGLADTEYAEDLRTRLDAFRDKRQQAVQDEVEATREAEDDINAG